MTEHLHVVIEEREPVLFRRREDAERYAAVYKLPVDDAPVLDGEAAEAVIAEAEREIEAHRE